MTDRHETPTDESLAEKASKLPVDPGVYLMKDRRGSVIYVGKAKSLRARVRSYFQRLQDASPKTRLMVGRIADIDSIVTPTEKDALILENSLIKKYRPRFNINLRDDKEYPYLRLPVDESYPNLTIIRKPRKDGSVYYGPFASAQAVRATLKVLHKLFPIRKCRGKPAERSRPCLYYEMGRCLAPCCNNVDPGEYRRMINDIRLFLQGRSDEVVRSLRRQMDDASRQLHFEQAALIRDRIADIERTLARQSVVCLDFIDRDVFAFCRQGPMMVVTALFIRSGRMVGSRSEFFKNVRLSDEETLFSCISQYYHQGAFIPSEVVVPFAFSDKALLEECLREKKESRVCITRPHRGMKKDLLEMAAKNAEAVFSQKIGESALRDDMLMELQQRLGLETLPERIECFDISALGGTAAVGSMVVFRNGEPYKAGYRRFRIKTVHGSDDYAMMYEVLMRRLSSIREGESPDLLIVDGGKGQLAVLCRALEECGAGGTGAASLAKGPERERAKKMQEEKVYLPGRKNPVPFPKNSPALFLLQRIRDEAHRFAVSYHTQLKTRQDLTSVLETLPGIGKQTVKLLVRHFGSIPAAREASRDDIAAVSGITRSRAEKIFGFFHPPDRS